jgi:hypothetical protein
MKKLSFVVLAVLAPTAFVLSAQAGNTGSTLPNTRPVATIGTRPSIDLSPTITDLDFTNGGSPKVNAALKPVQLDLSVASRGPNPKSGTFAVKNQGATVAAGQFSVGPNSEKALSFYDPIGVQNACVPAKYDVSIKGAGFEVSKKAVITPTCQFASKTSNPWNLMTPDHVEANKANRVWFNSATITNLPSSSASCNQKSTFTTTVKNDTGHPVSAMRLDVKRDGAVKASSQLFALGTNQSKTVTVDLYFMGDAGSYQLHLADTQGTAAGKIASSAASLDVTRTCSLTTVLTQ